ncbi:DNA polymerase Y family protein [Xanthobacter sp. DSM 24535]|uniref:Y-family DNA polymerase n=1 Tax=Roseixanthobacter psychrophilus TaxID=3119917 RepID=UPI00372C1BC5
MSAPRMPSRRYLCLWLDRLSTDRLERSLPPDARLAPRATLVMEKSALRLAAVNGAARALGLKPGLSLADARARHPGLEVADHAADADARLLGHVADACERYTPLLVLDPLDALILDISGCAHLFGGERNVVADLQARVAARGYSTRAAIASTLGAAWALAHFGARPALVAEDGADLPAVLAPLPLAALRLDAPVLAALARLGFAQIGDLAGKPRAPLAARFGTALLERLDQATGQAREAVEHRFPPPRFCAERSLSDPIERADDVLGLAHHLATKLATALERAGKGARHLELTLFRVDGQVTRLKVGASRPLRDPLAIRRLFAEKVAQVASLDAGFGFDLLRLSVILAEDMTPHQQGFDARQAEEAALDALVDRLAARFGGARVQHISVADAHLPEEAGCAIPLARRRLPFDAGALADPLADPSWPETDTPVGIEGADAPHPATPFPLSPSVRPLRALPERDDAVLVPLPRGSGLREGAEAASRVSPDALGPATPHAPEADSHRPVAARSPRSDGGEHPDPVALLPTPSTPPSPPRPTRRAAGAPPQMAAARPDAGGAVRPQRLFDHPEAVEAVAEVPDGPPLRFRWRRRMHHVARVEGPERIAAPWWRETRLRLPLLPAPVEEEASLPRGLRTPTRDYFRVETQEGLRLWLFRAGLYGRETNHPAWYVHGLFG